MITMPTIVIERLLEIHYAYNIHVLHLDFFVIKDEIFVRNSNVLKPDKKYSKTFLVVNNQRAWHQYFFSNYNHI